MQPEQLRQHLLAVVVGTDLEIRFAVDGPEVTGVPSGPVPWAEVADAIPAGAAADPAAVRLALTRWVHTSRWLAQPVEMLRETVRVLGMPARHPLHPGKSWVAERVHGDSLHLGFGAEGIDPTRPDDVVPIPPAVFARAGLDPAPWWPLARLRQERMGELAALRVATGAFGKDRLRPVGGHDVVTLLGTATLRRALAERSDLPMVSVAVPSRAQGWLLMNRVDPAFASLASEATALADKGFTYPTLVTRDEVVEVPPHGDVIGQALADPLPQDAPAPVPFYAE